MRLKSKTTRAQRSKLPDLKPPRPEQEIFTDLAALCSSPGFAHAIAYFCYRDNFVRYADKLTPDDLGRIRSGSELIRTEISTLIGLLAKNPIDLTLPASDVTQQYIDRAEALLHELHQSLQSVWFKHFSPEKVKAGEFDPFSSGEALREPIFYGGDSAYNFQYCEFAAKKYAKDNVWLETHKGFDIDAALSFAKVVGELHTKKQNALPDVLKAKRPSEWTMLPAFCFSVQELVDYGMDPRLVERVITSFCLPEEDRNKQFVALQEYNATNASPILSLGNGSFVLFQHYSLLESIYESPFFWMAEDKLYAPTALSHRGDFTEDVAIDRLRKVFGGYVHANAHIQRSKSTEVGEVDVLVLFGDRAIVLQAKSKRLTLEARKGNDAQVKADFKRAIQDAYNQANECAKALIGGECRLVGDTGNEINVPMSIREIFPVCVVSDHYPALAFQVRQFLEAEETSAIRAPLVIDVFALDAMTEMLETPLRLLSYLQLRSKFSQRLLSGHEHTLLSTHLKRNLWVNTNYDMVILEDDISIHLDSAMIVRREGVPGARTPDGVLTRMQGTHVGKIVSHIEARPDPATIPLGFLLLSLSEDSIDTLNDGIDYIIKQAASDGKNHDFTILFGESSSGITIHCNDEPNARAANHLFNHSKLRKYSERAGTWFGILLSPKTRQFRLGVTLDDEWKQDDSMDAATKKLRTALSPRDLRKTLDARKKIGRNDLCPCGSGRKYKKCCRP